MLRCLFPFSKGAFSGSSRPISACIWFCIVNTKNIDILAYLTHLFHIGLIYIYRFYIGRLKGYSKWSRMLGTKRLLVRRLSHTSTNIMFSEKKSPHGFTVVGDSRIVIDHCRYSNIMDTGNDNAVPKCLKLRSKDVYMNSLSEEKILGKKTHWKNANLSC